MAKLVEQVGMTLVGEEQINTHNRVKEILGDRKWPSWVKAKEIEFLKERDLSFGLTQEEINDSLHIEVESGQ